MKNDKFVQLYNSHMQALIKSYENVKSRFSTYVSKCLTEKQRRDCQMSLTAPPLVLPHEQRAKTGSPALEESKSEDVEGVRMGGRMGQRVNKLEQFKKEEDISYVSGDDRDLNESAQESQFNPIARKRSKLTANVIQSRI